MDLEIAKKAALLFIEALKFHNVKSFSVKFSGNNGFHIGIPQESFPEKFNNILTSILFPEAPKVMASYLKDMIKEHLTSSLLQESLDELLKRANKKREEVTEKICKKCKVKAIELKLITYQCLKCKFKEQKFSELLTNCPECNNSLSKLLEEAYLKCPRCSQQESIREQKSFEDGKFNPFSLVDIDTLLISSRHLFRCPYSINEKSSLLSLPIKPEEIKDFKKEQASIKKFIPGPTFLNRDVKEKDASALITKAYESYSRQQNTKEKLSLTKAFKARAATKAIPQDAFPPCIIAGLKGLQDGKKRFIFILYNFLSNIGYNDEEISSIMQDWNKNNPQSLRENYIQAQLSWSSRQKQKILPPNCSNQAYYPDLGICKPDSLCRLIKNPVNYSLRKQSEKERLEKENEEQKKKKPEKPIKQPKKK